MARWRLLERHAVLPMLAWLGVLALLPWWLGLPLLLAMAFVLLLPAPWPVEHARLLRRGLRWGLPGVMFALQRALGGGPFGLGAALLGALAGYTLIAGLEAWLDRDLRRAPAGTTSDAEWPELARAPIGPPARIIELRPPQWQPATAEFADPRGGTVQWRAGSYRFADGLQLDGGDRFDFSPQGRWFAARPESGRRLVLYDRDHRRCHRLRGWRLCGWDGEHPWLQRREGDMPLPLDHVAGARRRR
ncbi:hypothetical protein [Rhodanobacter caeni]|uniref:Uncharacterized protein n=1 Tax=Rhodanobacter caeni TaxID=657654 RepID=A0ABN0U5P3_9GAMM